MRKKSHDLAEIESRFRSLRNDAMEIADMNEKVRRLNLLSEEELRSVNLPTVWTTIEKLWAAGKIQRSYLFAGELGPENPIKHYMVTEEEMTFFDRHGLAVVSRAEFDLANDDLDEVCECTDGQRGESSAAPIRA